MIGQRCNDLCQRIRDRTSATDDQDSLHTASTKGIFFIIQVREQQPEKQAIQDFFEGRHLDNNSHKAVLWCIEQRAQTRLPITGLAYTMRDGSGRRSQKQPGPWFENMTSWINVMMWNKPKFIIYRLCFLSTLAPSEASTIIALRMCRKRGGQSSQR